MLIKFIGMVGNPPLSWGLSLKIFLPTLGFSHIKAQAASFEATPQKDSFQNLQTFPFLWKQMN